MFGKLNGSKKLTLSGGGDMTTKAGLATADAPLARGLRGEFVLSNRSADLSKESSTLLSCRMALVSLGVLME